ncbi:hypothetical protein CAPN008_05980 [Capnocytophaga canis]|uniref:hypothetical protein n=1 Tax=Capnocytophaga canis TaxID=1848903 RepID=UPI001AC5AAF8|nr:hypothetical protein [Capnocytophaga canis]GIM60548.1 hypothetical protein CAPN008_05980 [Capnocytophaga canis]
MENIIKNIHKIRDYLSDDELKELNEVAFMHRRFSRIYFKILKVDDDLIRIEVKQEKSPHNNYFEVKRLTEIVQETFAKFFPKHAIQKVPLPYIESPVEVVTPQWVKDKMNKHKIGSKKLVEDFGVAKSEISAMINEHTSMSNRSKAMFYYYFKYIELLDKDKG